MTALIASFLFVLLAEMGDKTQLLAMAFAAKYRASQVLTGVFIATLLNHSLAVLAGRMLTVIIPMDVISLVAAFSFIIFGLWTIRGDRLEGEDKKKSSFGPIVTVGIAFFMVEMGDKTQLATISLAIQYSNVLSVLMGTTLAMVVADAIGIVIGIVMRKHIPEQGIKWFSAVVFILFGMKGIYSVLSGKLSPSYLWALLLAVMFITILAAYFIKNKKSEK